MERGLRWDDGKDSQFQVEGNVRAAGAGLVNLGGDYVGADRAEREVVAPDFGAVNVESRAVVAKEAGGKALHGGETTTEDLWQQPWLRKIS